MAFVSITRLRVRSPEFLDPFSATVPDVYTQASTAPGNLASDLLAEANDTFWTRTVWTDRAAMRAYMTSGAHGDVMPLLRDWCDEAHVAHWEQESEELPTWQEAHRRIVAEGRTSAVAHPSPDHAARTVAPPVTT
jgi:heme-degrading monooxygenase HmoA